MIWTSVHPLVFWRTGHIPTLFSNIWMTKHPTEDEKRKMKENFLVCGLLRQFCHVFTFPITAKMAFKLLSCFSISHWGKKCQNIISMMSKYPRNTLWYIMHSASWYWRFFIVYSKESPRQCYGGKVVLLGI